jgi:hypothetical protein
MKQQRVVTLSSLFLPVRVYAEIVSRNVQLSRVIIPHLSHVFIFLFEIESLNSLRFNHCATYFNKEGR